jgi:ACS family glucarate transporter-like MFS transporter
MQAFTGAKARSHVRAEILAIILLLATVACADRSILSMSASGIKQAFGLSAVQLGYILSAFSWAYVIGQVPGGLLLDYFGTKQVAGIALILWSLATFVLGFAGYFAASTVGAVVILFALRFALGIIEAPAYPANARATIMWFPKSERGFATSLFVNAQYFAVAIFSPLAGWLVSQFGWPWPFFVLGVVGFLSAVVWYAFMREPRHHPRVSQGELDYIMENGALVDIDAASERTAKSRLTWSVVKSLLTNRMLWCAYIGQYCIIALSYFFITWFPVYLVQGRGMDILNAGFATMAPSLFAFFGAHCIVAALVFLLFMGRIERVGEAQR